ncbi:MAG: beta-lactamase family protein [Planctomycetes bacterium]|nr:beta-lactamase family protein [Planctomycetota bacterium]
MRTRLLAWTLLISSCVSGPTPADAVDRHVAAHMARHHLPGLSLAVIRDGRVVLARGYGLADVEQRVPATPDTVYELGSLTKQFTAVAVLMLECDGRLGLDDTIVRWLPEASPALDGITLRHLLTHTSGIRNHVALPDFLGSFRTNLFGDTTPHRRELLQRFFELPREFEPGATWAYDNTGYHLLGDVVERASGQGYWEFLADRLFAPLGMDATASTDARPLVPHRARGYEWNGHAFENRPALPPEVGYAAGAVRSNVLDLARWDAALSGDRLLDAERRALLWTPMRTSDGAVAPYDYGFGWFVDTWHGGRIAMHGGGSPGFSSVVYRYLDDRLTVAVLCNRSDRMLDRLAIDIAGLVDPGLARPGPSEDPEPTTTQELREVLEGLLDGNHDPARFTPAMRTFLATRTGQGFWEWHRAHGALTSFAFCERESTADGPLLRFELGLDGNPYWCSFRLAPDGRIQQIRIW